MTKTTKVWSIDVFEIREIIRLYYVETFNRNQIALALKKSFSTITSIIARLESSGVAPEVLAQMSDTELRSVVYPKPPGPKDEPTRVRLDLEYLSGELQRKGVTRQLLWHEYCDNNPEGTYSYSRFCEHLRSYMQQSQLSMVLDHPPGERAYCDYASDTVISTAARSSDQLRSFGDRTWGVSEILVISRERSSHSQGAVPLQGLPRQQTSSRKGSESDAAKIGK